MKTIIVIQFVLLMGAAITLKEPVNSDLNRRLELVRSKVKNVNKGGCGFLAWYIHRYLGKHNIKHNIVKFYTKDYPNLHYMVEVDGTFIDISGYYSETPFFIFTAVDVRYICIQPETLRRKLNDELQWASAFNRADTTVMKRCLGLL